jgi:signal transduction histidine kinase
MVAADILRRPRRVDVVIGLGCAAFSLAALLLLPVLTAVDPDAAVAVLRPWSPRWWSVVLGVCAQGLVLVWVGPAPRAALTAIAALAFGLSWTTPVSAYSLSRVAVMAVVFLTVARVPMAALRSALLPAALLVVIGEAVTAGRDDASPRSGLFAAVAQGIAVVAIPLFVGLFVRSRRDVREARRDEQQARAGERDAQLEAAVSRERTAMARELHDIAAHHLSGIALMAAVVDRQIEVSPEQAHVGAQQIRAQSTAVLEDLRRLVGLLRDDTGDGRSVETLATVPDLVDRARVQGPIELRMHKAADRDLGAGIGPLAQLALYRTIQEALTNAATHAPGAQRTVEIDDREQECTVVTVTNTAPTRRAAALPSGGFGLLGMRERSELVGATLRYGPIPDGWQVRVSVPREATRPADAVATTSPDPG